LTLLKPFKIDGKVYENVKVTNSKKEIVEKWRDRNITKTITIEKTKVLRKKDNTIFMDWFICCITAGIIIYLKIK
jgi:hypothetical protein